MWDYLRDPEVSITTLEQKQSIFSRTIGVAGALAYLHDELFLAATGEQLCCYHLDLKPTNILIFEEGKRVIWKVSDFGISVIKRKPASRKLEHPISPLNNIFRPDQSSAEPSSGVQNTRYAGTYTAPEARHRYDKVTRTSDVWSLGCVLTLVLAFFDNQRTGIEDFSNARMKDRDDDLFYDSDPTPNSTDSKPSLRSSVPAWLKHLRDNANSRSKAEGVAVSMVSSLIQERMLLPNPIDRRSAREVEKALKAIQPYFTPTNTLKGAPHEQLHQIVEEPHSNSPGLGRIRGLITGYRSTSAHTPMTWQFEIPKSTRRCQLSHNGKYLGIQSSDSITTSSVWEIRHNLNDVSRSTPSQERFSDFSLGSEHLCAAVDSPNFKVRSI